MSRFEIVEAKTYHCGRMSRLLRAQHANEVTTLGFDVHREIRVRFLGSWFRRAWLIDGELVGLGGVSGPLVSTTGMIWLALTPAAARHPIHAAKEAERQLSEIMTLKQELWTYLLEGDAPSHRFAELLGFEPGEDGYWTYRRRS